MTALCFLRATRGNFFINEVLEMVAAAARRRGIDTVIMDDRYPDPEPGVVYVVVPHEFFVLAPGRGGYTSQQLELTIGLCVEQPATHEFELTCEYGAQLGAVLAIHPRACAELERRGARAKRLQLGYVPEWDRWRGADRERPIDVLYLGANDERRARYLASYGATLATRHSRLLLARYELRPQPAPGDVAGSDKYDLMSSSRICLNLHRAGAAGLEWVRVLEAICNGAVVVSEHSLDPDPLVAGVHYLSGRPENLALLADGLLDDEVRLSEMRTSAYDLVRNELPIEPGIDLLANVADWLRADPPAPNGAGGSLAAVPAPVTAADHVAAAVADRVAAAPAKELAPVRAALRDLRIEMLAMRRAISRLESLARQGDDGSAPVAIYETPSFAQAQPRVSVAISLFNYEREVLRALRSVAASEHDAFELLILDDASTDASVAAVTSFLAERPWLPARLLGHQTNQGQSRVRNVLFDRARGGSVFVLDADNAIYPTTLARLEAALESDPGAVFAYSLVALFDNGEPSELLGAHDWNPRALVSGNYIDAMAMVRRDELIAIGGYAEDVRLTGGEDYDLWCRFADAGRRAVHVPEILCVYERKAHGTNESIGKIDLTIINSLIRARAPRLFGGDLDDFSAPAGAGLCTGAVSVRRA